MAYEDPEDQANGDQEFNTAVTLTYTQSYSYLWDTYHRLQAERIDWPDYLRVIFPAKPPPLDRYSENTIKAVELEAGVFAREKTLEELHIGSVFENVISLPDSVDVPRSHRRAGSGAITFQEHPLQLTKTIPPPGSIGHQAYLAAITIAREYTGGEAIDPEEILFACSWDETDTDSQPSLDGAGPSTPVLDIASQDSTQGPALADRSSLPENEFQPLTDLSYARAIAFVEKEDQFGQDNLLAIDLARVELAEATASNANTPTVLPDVPTAISHQPYYTEEIMATPLEQARQARGKNVEPLGSTIAKGKDRDGKGKRKKTPDEVFEEHQRMAEAAMVLESWEMLAFHALANEESIPETRLRFEQRLLGIEENNDKPGEKRADAGPSQEKGRADGAKKRGQ
ncbi:MAG: hypothetical protein M1817_002659 [Caeruleum heppii]|nr:MAG: hypothetical protein M1817_002659 [Caeruleum heppii]